VLSVVGYAYEIGNMTENVRSSAGALLIFCMRPSILDNPRFSPPTTRRTGHHA
jgi:hypothetical protein